MMIDIILRESVKKLGKIGEIVKVRSGYARNYLLPQKKALRASKENLQLFEDQRLQLETLNHKKLLDAEALSQSLKDYTATLIRQAGESGQLYGSISAKDIMQALVEKGFPIKKEQVGLHAPIKTIGFHSIHLNLHPEVSVKISLVIAQSVEEAESAKYKLTRSKEKKQQTEETQPVQSPELS